MHVNGGTLTTPGGGGEVFSDIYDPATHDSLTTSLVAQRTAGATAFDISLQGSIVGDANDADWVDTGSAATAQNISTPFRVGTKDDLVWRYYRVRLHSTAGVTVSFRFIQADG